MATVKSVERLTITLAADTASNNASMTKGQTAANCVPLMTHRVTTPAVQPDRWDQLSIDISISGSTVTAATNSGANRALQVEVTIIEFHSSAVTVQSGVFSMTGAEATDSVGITAVDLAKSAAICYWETGTTTEVQDPAFVRCRFSDDSNLAFDRATANGTIDGHWFVFEANGTEFAVDQKDITLDAVASNTASITAVTTASTFLLTTFTADSNTTDDNSNGSIYVDLQDTTTIRVRRAGTTGIIVATVFAIEFSGDEGVQRGLIEGQGSVASENVDITAVNLTWASVMSPSGTSHKNASFPGVGSSDNSDSMIGLDFVDTDTIRVRHSTDGGEADNDISWEVVEWEEFSAAGTVSDYRYPVRGVM